MLNDFDDSFDLVLDSQKSWSPHAPFLCAMVLPDVLEFIQINLKINIYIYIYYI